jgi:hypothetical protein
MYMSALEAGDAGRNETYRQTTVTTLERRELLLVASGE